MPQRLRRVLAASVTAATSTSTPAPACSPTGPVARGAFFSVLRCLALAALTAAGPALAVSQDSGRNNRQSSGQEAVSVTACTLTPIWQLATLPSVPEYCRATPGELLPSFGKPLSSTAQATGAIASTALRANRTRTASVSQVEVVTNCCSP